LSDCLIGRDLFKQDLLGDDVSHSIGYAVKYEC